MTRTVRHDRHEYVFAHIIRSASSESYRYCREIIISPFWLRTIIMEIMVLVATLVA
jgi:hypothetical protein